MIRKVALLAIVTPFIVAGCKAPNSESIVAQANDFLSHDRYADAAKVVEPVVRDHPGNWQAQLAYGRALLGEGDLEGARRALDRAHNLQSSNPDAVFSLADCMARQNDSAAAYQLLRGYGREFHSWKAYTMLSDIAEKVGDADTALQAADDAIKVSEPAVGQKNPVEPYLRAASVSFKYGKEDAGVRRLRQAYGISPDDPRVAQQLREHGLQPGKAIALPPGV